MTSERSHAPTSMHLAERRPGRDPEPLARGRRRPPAARSCCSRCRRPPRRRRPPARGRRADGAPARRPPQAQSGGRTPPRAACPTPSATSACRAAPPCGRSPPRGWSAARDRGARRGSQKSRRSGFSSSSRITTGSPGQIASTVLLVAQSRLQHPRSAARSSSTLRTARRRGSQGSSRRSQRRSSRIARDLALVARLEAGGAAAPCAPPGRRSGRPATAASRRACLWAPPLAPPGPAAAVRRPPTRSPASRRARVGRLGRDVHGVGGGEEAGGGVPGDRQAAVLDEALPLVAAVARHRHQPVPVGPHRRAAGGRPADVALGVGIDQVQRRGAPAVAGGLEVVPVLARATSARSRSSRRGRARSRWCGWRRRGPWRRPGGPPGRGG